MTDGILSAIADWTGETPSSCPWRAYFDPFVNRVADAFGAFEDGNLAVALPDPSHRLVQGVMFYRRVTNRIVSEQLDHDRKERERARAQGGG